MKKILLSVWMLSLVTATASQGDGLSPGRGIDRQRLDPAQVNRIIPQTEGTPDAGGATLSIKRGDLSAEAEHSVPAAPSDLAVVYGYSSRRIHVVWSQPGDEPVSYWRIYYALSGGGPYAELGRVNNDGRTQQAFSVPLTVPPGGKATIYLVVISFRKEDISAESREAHVQVDHSDNPPGGKEIPGMHDLPAISNPPITAALPLPAGRASSPT